MPKCCMAQNSYKTADKEFPEHNSRPPSLPNICFFSGSYWWFFQKKNFWPIFAKILFQYLVKLHALKRIIWSSKFRVWICVTGMRSILLLLTIMFFIDFLHNLYSACHSNLHLWPLFSFILKQNFANNGHFE